LGKLVPFDKRRRPSRGAPADASDSGQVVIFTGVRYQRDTPPQPTGGHKPQRPSRKRG